MVIECNTTCIYYKYKLWTGKKFYGRGCSPDADRCSFPFKKRLVESERYCCDRNYCNSSTKLTTNIFYKFFIVCMVYYGAQVVR
ncbi:hypothetical protein SNEBB_009990 [Seison nebaliae]|nr:hypothetical protein SNEBB_009990 [Seison nebaliae]